MPSMLAVNKLLAEKGFENADRGRVAAEVEHCQPACGTFPAKELAAAAVVRILQRTQIFWRHCPRTARPKLRSVARWAMQVHLAGRNALAAQRKLQPACHLMGRTAYLDALARVSDQLGEWIIGPRPTGTINPAIPHRGAVHPVCPCLRSGAGFHESHRAVQHQKPSSNRC